LKYGIFVHPKRPKISVAQIAGRINSAGFLYSPNEPDIGIVVGGDGTFGYYGRILRIPMLFVGVKESDILGSKAKLAESMYDRLDKSLHDIDAGRYSVNDKNMLAVNFAGQSSDVLTDVYLERGEFAGCIRYAIQVNNGRSSFNEYAIGNGVIASTSFGSAGYFSYPDRLKAKKWHQNSSVELFSDNRLGICHIIPTYLVREMNGKHHLTNKIQYTVPKDYQIQIKLVRDANARVYGTTEDSKGKQVLLDQKITISLSKNTAKIIKLKRYG
jgi:NAD+ kinase